MTLADLHWLAGFLEGEGCFSIYRRKGLTSYGSPHVQVCSTDMDVLCRAAELMGAKHREVKKCKTGNKRVWLSELSGAKALSLMETLLPLMGVRRQARIREVIALAATRPGPPTGERCYISKLTKEIVADLRSRPFGHKYGAVTAWANQYGVSPQTMWYAVRGKTWKSAGHDYQI